MALSVFMVAGEHSGDIIGANLIKALRSIAPGCKISGVGGQRMMDRGLKSLFPIEEISLIGYTEVLLKVLKLRRLLDMAYEEVLKVKPDVVVTIDSPGFNWRLARRIRKHFGDRIKLVNYVAPSVWAYKPNRVYKVKELYNHQLLILPIEKKYFDEVECPATYVGHPILEKEIAPYRGKSAVYHKHSIPANHRLITVMPGSREGEIRRHVPILLEAMDIIHTKFPNTSFCIPMVRGLEPMLREEFRSVSPIMVSEGADRDGLLMSSDMAIAKSGTTTLELALYNLPMVVTYKVSILTALIARTMITTKYFALCNIILDEEVVPELIQGKCNAKNIADQACALLADTSKCALQKEKLRNVIEAFLGHSIQGKAPSMLAAEKILEVVGYNG